MDQRAYEMVIEFLDVQTDLDDCTPDEKRRINCVLYSKKRSMQMSM